jgi:hypothetical protein
MNMMIDFNKVGYVLNKRKQQLKIQGFSEFVKEYAHDKCHYYTVALCEILGIDSISLFYLKTSGRIIHSAVKLSDSLQIIDAYGLEEEKNILALWDATNYMTGIYQKEGNCLAKSLSYRDFNPSEFYENCQLNAMMPEIKNVAHKWLSILDIKLPTKNGSTVILT